MKFTISLLLLLISAGPLISQPNTSSNTSFIKVIKPLKNNTFELREITKDSILICKGTLISKDPVIKQGRFYFYNSLGRVDVIGYYHQNYPYGTWVYLNDKNDTIKLIDYTAVWRYLETDALDYTIDSTVINSLKPKDNKFMNEDGTFYKVTEMPKFKGGDPSVAFAKYIMDNAYYPAYSQKKGIVGSLVVQFIVDDEGLVRNPIIVNSLSPDIDIEVLRVISESPRWEPGKQRKKPVNVVLSLPFSFFPDETTDLMGLLSEIIVPEPALINDDNLKDLDQLPLFRGNEWLDGFRFMIENLTYPDQAAEKGKSGKVLVEFTIMPDGSIDSINVVESVYPEIDEEAIRVIRQSGYDWTPGTKDGVNVATKLIFPFNFILEND